jgi:hypothetical protein
MGTVKHVATGWPDAAPKFEIAPPTGPVSREAMAFLNMVVGSRASQERRYARLGGLGDVDMRTAFNVRSFPRLIHWSYKIGVASSNHLLDISANMHRQWIEQKFPANPG